MRNRAVPVIVITLTVLILSSRHALINGWSLLTGRGYVIPVESSIFEFRATVMNEGSGEWWTYGEDSNYYYHFTGDDAVPYIKFPKSLASACKSFEPSNHLTWCKR